LDSSAGIYVPDPSDGNIYRFDMMAGSSYKDKVPTL
jgi:hypothetical protein